MKRLIMGVAVATLFLCASQRAQATLLPPGGTVAPPSTTLSGGTYIASGTATATALSGPTDWMATVHFAVYKEAGGTLDFLYQVHTLTPPSTNGVVYVQNHGFTGFATDVSTITALSGADAAAGFEGPTAGVNPNQAHRLNSGEAVDWSNFSNPIDPGKISSVLVIKTDATLFVTGTSELHNGSIGFSPSFAPTPEPASLVLLGGCFAGLGVAGAWRRLRKPVVVVS